MTSIAIRMADRLVRLTLAFLSLVLAASCGSGGVSGPAPVNDPTRITILPATATAFSGLPTTFVISGGTGSYIVTSSHQSIIPVAGSISGGSLTVVPNQVTADTVVTLTVRDTGTTPIATATVTVRPGTVGNSITITPTSSQGGNCAPAICSGGDAEVVATLSQGGIPLSGRGVRFEVVSGDFLFITSAPGSSVETLDTSVTVVSDETGKARARIRVLANAPNQTALLQVTDLVSGAFQRTSFVIAQATGSSPGFFVSPTSVTFQGARQDECATTNISATFYIFGGAAPYTVSSTSSAFFVGPTFVSSSGGSFTVTPNGQCVTGAPIIVRDSSGRTVTVTVANIPGTVAPPALTVTPETVTLSSCTGTANVTIAGGRGTGYFVSSGSDSITASLSGNTVTIRRQPGSPANAGPVNVGVSDGTTVANVTVNLTGEGAGVCLGATPSSVSLTSCTSVATVTISGGSGTYNAISNRASVRATPSGSTVTIDRTPPASLAFTPPATVTVTDPGNPAAPAVAITVNASGAGAGACP